jgi:4a-hydroxytetrahydrobiopterin dehydratase
MAGKDVLSPERLEDALAVLPDWQYSGGALVTA